MPANHLDRSDEYLHSASTNAVAVQPARLTNPLFRRCRYPGPMTNVMVFDPMRLRRRYYSVTGLPVADVSVLKNGVDSAATNDNLLDENPAGALRPARKT